MRFEDVLRLFGEYFAREGIRSAVVSAAERYGLVAIDRSAQSAAIRIAEAHLFETLHATSDFSNHFDRTSGVVIDFVCVEEKTADDVFSRALTPHCVGTGVNAPVVTREDAGFLKAIAAVGWWSYSTESATRLATPEYADLWALARDGSVDQYDGYELFEL